MKIKSTLAALGVCATLSAIAHAETAGQSYLSIQYGLGTYSEEGFEDANPNFLMGKLGYFVNDGLSLEGRLGIGVGDDSINDPFAGELTIEVDSLIGVYGVGHARISEAFSLYGLLGFTRGELTATAPAFGMSFSDDDTGLSYGVGLNIGSSESTSLNIEYTQYLDETYYDFTAVGLGIFIPIN